MELESLRVGGIRSLAAVDWIPVRCPTIITGPNDGGKTSLLLALSFLLTGRGLATEDFTLAGAGEKGEFVDGRYEECWVEGTFRLTPEEQSSPALPEALHLRRVGSIQGAVRLEVLQLAPSDTRLRELDSRTLTELKQLAADFGLAPNGPANHKESFLAPLRDMAESSPFEEAWVPVAAEVAQRLPRLILFASTQEPNPEAEIRQALQEAYAQALEDPLIIAPVREAEERVRRQVEEAAADLCGHIVTQCPEITRLKIAPSVSFKEGFAGVSISSARGSMSGVGLQASGAGTRRRITLAIWEWTRLLLTSEATEGRSVVVAYDEPDTHLDYGHQRDFVNLVRRQCELPGVRLIVATHSMNLIDKVPIEDVVHMELVDERSVVRRLFAAEHADVDRFLVDIAASMGLGNTVLLHERCFLAVEGVTEQQALPILFRLATGMSLQAAGIALVPAGGNLGARALCMYLVGQGRAVRFAVDRDSTANHVFNSEHLKADGVGEGAMYLLGEPSEIEDLFSDDQWATVAQEEWPRKDGEAWTVGQFASLRPSGKFSRQLFEVLASESKRPPLSKASLLASLARTLSSPEKVPEQLTAMFADLVSLASQR